MKRKKICFVVSSPYTAKAFLENHFEVLSEFYDVYLVANFDDGSINNYTNSYLKDIKHIPILRKISIIKDIKALFLLSIYLYKNKFDVVTTFTPKAGLIGILASKIAGVKRRIYFFTGQVWHTKTGMYKKILQILDKVAVFFSTDIIVDGNPQRDFLIENKIISKNNSIVIGKGTISGIDTKRFSQNNTIRNILQIHIRTRSNIVAEGKKSCFRFYIYAVDNACDVGFAYIEKYLCNHFGRNPQYTFVFF